ncbi:MAG: hypothetical protein A2086_07285 [Spirochaetes bacterium GWD1_27_9]|nr:MAG: hypothetical protein A2Z98_07460 [Spirochaetes bacterium GWB1_27_13]OHD29096.1 MAG: hypothetical protein A2086_07285 [Spirochaetes bacterium GWD1_27_9]
MNDIIFSNRRQASRFSVKIQGKISIFDKDTLLGSEKIEIVDISYAGIHVNFSNNDFLYHYLNCVDNENLKVLIEFNFYEEEYKFENNIIWINIEDVGEKYFLVHSGLGFKIESKEYFKDKHLDLIVSQYMENSIK